MAFLNHALLRDRWVSLGVLLFAIGLALGTYHPAAMEWAFVHLSTFFMAGLFFAWILSLGGLLKAQERPVLERGRSWAVGTGLSLAIAVVIFSSVPCQLRVLADEANLMSVSQSMVLDRRCDQVSMAYRYLESFHPLDRELPTRPLLFPFLIHLAHLILGIEVSNVFVVNFILLVVFLSLVYHLLSPRWGVAAGLAAILFTASQPLLSLIATSGGYDLLYVLLMFVGFVALREYLQREDRPSFHFLWMTLLLLANTRHESFVYVGLAMGFLFVFGRLKIADMARSPWVMATPLFLLPFVWQKILVFSKLTGYVPAGTAAFSFDHFLRQNQEFLGIISSLNGTFPYANSVWWLGALTVCAATVLLARGRLSLNRPQSQLCLIAVVNSVVSWLIMTSYFWGEASNPASCRFYLLPGAILSVLGALGAATLLRRRPSGLVAVGLILWMSHHGIAVKDEWFMRISEWREYRFVTDYFSKQPDRNFLVVVDVPRKYTIYGYGAISHDYARAHSEDILRRWRNHLWRSIYVLQTVPSGNEEPFDLEKLPDDFRLKTLAELQTWPDARSRISEVVE